MKALESEGVPYSRVWWKIAKQEFLAQLATTKDLTFPVLPKTCVIQYFQQKQVGPDFTLSDYNSMQGVCRRTLESYLYKKERKEKYFLAVV